MDGAEALQVRRRLGRALWGAPAPFGTDGWRFDRLDPQNPARIIVSDGPAVLGSSEEYRHASISRPSSTPTYEDLQLLHRAVWGETGWSCQVFVPAAEHINIHPHALHLWGWPDGSRMLPAFGTGKSI